MNILNIVQKKINLSAASKKNKSFLLLISGGVDSVVLLNILIKIMNFNNNKLFLLHCNYGTNKNSHLSQKKCNELATENNLKIFIKNTTLKDSNFEHKARLYRYKAAAKLSKLYSIDYILTAHHYDDQLETLYMQGAFNSDWLSSLGIREAYGKIFRPMLSIKRKSIIDYAIKNNIKWIHDSTNDDIGILRNNIRHKILPEIKKNFPGQVKDIFYKHENKYNKYICLKNKILDNQHLFVIDESVNFFSISNKIIDKTLIDNLKLYYQIYTKNILNIYIRGSRDHWANFFNFIKSSNTGKYFHFNNKISVLKEKNKHILYKNDYLSEKKVKISDSNLFWYDTKIITCKHSFNKSNVKFKLIIDKNNIKEGLFVRNRKAGDKCFSNFYNRYISLSNIFINNKISNFDKAKYPVVVNSYDEILSVPNLYNKVHFSLIAQNKIANIYWINQYAI